MALCLLFLAAAVASAFGEIRYPDRPLNLRASRSAKARWVGSLYPGQKVRIAFMKDGWVAIFEPGETRADESAAVGYSNAKYLVAKPGRVEPESWGELMYTPRKLNIRSGPSVKTARRGALDAGERVKVDFPDGDWVMVFDPGATIRSEMNARGYCAAKYFEPVKTQTKAAPARATEQAAAPADVGNVVSVASGKGQVGGSVASAPKPVAATPKSAQENDEDSVAPGDNQGSSDWGKVVTLQEDINLRQERTSTSPRVRTLRAGDRVRVDYLKNGWYAVFVEGEVLRSENRALGYALRSLVDSEDQPAPVPAPAQSAGTAVAQDGPRTLVIDRTKFTDAKRPDPTPNKTAHGYQYRLLEKSETKKYGETWITLKVFLSTTKLPGADQIKDFCTTMWTDHRRATKNLVVLLYLPGMDTEDLAYGVVSFDDSGLLELWVRRVALFGTDFL
jgi:Bacterial SH3 domain.